MARRKTDNEIFMEIVFGAGETRCQEMIETLRAKINSLRPKKARAKKVKAPAIAEAGN